jgi:excisionase family DNA binding protein
MPVTEEVYLTAEEVATKLRLSPETVMRLLRQKKLPGFKVGGTWRISQKDLEHYIEEQKKK